MKINQINLSYIQCQKLSKENTPNSKDPKNQAKLHEDTTYQIQNSCKQHIKQQWSYKAVYLGMVPSGLIPCSRQYNSQHEFPTWIPACPIWILIISLIFCVSQFLPLMQTKNHKEEKESAKERKQRRFFDCICFISLEL